QRKKMFAGLIAHSSLLIAGSVHSQARRGRAGTQCIRQFECANSKGVLRASLQAQRFRVNETSLASTMQLTRLRATHRLAYARVAASKHPRFCQRGVAETRRKSELPASAAAGGQNSF